MTSNCRVFEAEAEPGGICCSYYLRKGETKRMFRPPKDDEAYRFEIGGGHWIFGGDPAVLEFIHSHAPMKRYGRESAVFFSTDRTYVDYPIQNNLRQLPAEIRSRALAEMSRTPAAYRTMKEWQFQHFGATLCDTFFFPFHDLYTAGFYSSIAPQDAFKSPVNLALAIQGAFQAPAGVGYNTTFGYPIDGLDTLSKAMASKCSVIYGKRAVRIDTKNRTATFADGTVERFKKLLCTLPLNKTLAMAGLETALEPYPYTSVLVLNVGASKGTACPPHHWLYNPDTKSGFHRVGFYSNVDSSFLPRSARKDQSAVSIYVERAYKGGTKPSPAQIKTYAKAVVHELKEWNFIKEAEVVDPTWIDVAYTWEWPGSDWKNKSLKLLQEHGIFMVGRYGRWVFQGIADSIRDGFFAGGCFKC
jgi:protoporphyrinogen oxidase